MNRRLIAVLLIVASLTLVAPPVADASESNCWPGETWMTQEGWPACALASPEGSCYYCEIRPPCATC